MEYICRDPRATVRASNMLAIVEAFQLLPTLIDDLLARHGVSRAALRTSQGIGMQGMLEVLKDIGASVGPSKLRQVGSHIVETALFPPVYGSVDDALVGLDQLYALNHTGDVGHYRTSRQGDGTIRVECATPYPREFERGLVEGIARDRTLAKGSRYLVSYADGPQGGSVTCVCSVRAMTDGLRPSLGPDFRRVPPAHGA